MCEVLQPHSQIFLFILDKWGGCSIGYEKNKTNFKRLSEITIIYFIRSIPTFAGLKSS